MQARVGAPFSLVLKTWLGDETRVLDHIRQVMKQKYPKLKRCTCCNDVSALNAFLDTELHVHSSPFLAVPATFVTRLPILIVNNYMRALNSKHIVTNLVNKCTLETDVTKCRELSKYITNCGGEDFENVILMSGAHASDVQQLHRFMMNCVLIKACAVVFVFIDQMDAVSCIKELTIKNSSGLCCNAVTDTGERCSKKASMRCPRCHRAFYCSKKCQMHDPTHVHECDTLTCTHSSVRRSMRSKEHAVAKSRS